MHVPLECPRDKNLKNLSWDANNNYQTSAVLACLLDTITLPIRVVPGYSRISSIGPALECDIDLESLCRIALDNGKLGQMGYVIAALEVPTLVLDYNKKKNNILELPYGSFVNFT